MSASVRKTGTKVSAPDPSKRRFVKRNNPVLGNAVENDSDILISF